ncbi:MAG: exodeoxyribonuclease VII small subunit [Nitrospirae bacterium]|uniref:exodeoxyribonuclease VII small subunit n=1 Tax=Candidatus Magnetobacterium casense TaxID=1455061 RepID=UPI00058FB2DA|nr:exodeoxyribonuclease VII small subunit [Candidatus Magnetobacterium casensis]MBF0336621.1 exodeoxyribonuclease VII small subunit [Nitrospirota bacterium]
MKEEKTYSQAIKEIEAIITDIEKETIDVDVLTERVKTAIELIKDCKGRLRRTEEELNGVLKEFEQVTVEEG